MSIDIFGRQLVSGGSAIRGPPGIGFKITANNQYDMDNKQLCNVGDAQQPNDAVSLKIVQATLQQVSHSLELKINNNISEQQAKNNDDIRNVMTETLEHIQKLDSQVKILEQFVESITAQNREVKAILSHLKVQNDAAWKSQLIERVRANLAKKEHEGDDNQRTS